MKPTRESWRPVVGWESRYEVSDKGRVRSLPTETRNQFGSSGVRPGRIRASHIDRRGYVTVNLYRDNTGKNHRVHRLVAEAFIGPCPSGMQVCHNDSDPLNNNVENLRYDTPAGNHADKIARGTTSRGRRNNHVKLHERDVRAIRLLYAEELYSQSDLADMYETTQPNIQRILNGSAWYWL